MALLAIYLVYMAKYILFIFQFENRDIGVINFKTNKLDCKRLNTMQHGTYPTG